MSASATAAPCAARSSAPNISAPRRSSPCRPRTAPCGLVCRPTSRYGAASMSASIFVPSSCRSSTRRVAVHCALAAWTGSCMAEIVLAGITKRFGDVSAVADLSLTIGDGEFMVLLGPTGAGKTTTLRLVAGLETPDSGMVRIAGHDVTQAPPAQRDVTFVFQQYSLYPHLSVYDNLAFPLRSPIRRVPEDEIERKVGEVAALLRIEAKLANRATQLSGGEMQRVAIGRALVRQPAVYLMDEPLSSLDAKLRAELRLELKRIQQDFGATMLYVTHDQIEAMTMATRIGVMSEGFLIQLS